MSDYKKPVWTERSRNIAVGIFVVAVAISLFFLAFRVSGLSQELTSTDTYTIKAHFQNIGGLTARSKVTIGGVAIGRVTNIYLDPKQLDAVVEMKIDSNMKQLTTDSVFSILTAGLLGEKYIGVVTGADEAMLKDGSVVDQSQTQSALVLEDLISKFVFNKTTQSAAGDSSTK